MRSQQSRYPLMRRSEVNNQPQQATVFLDSDQNPPVLTVKKPDGTFVSLEAAGAVDSVNGQTGEVELALSDIEEVDVSGAQNGDVLTFDNGEWIPSPVVIESEKATVTVSGGLGDGMVLNFAKNGNVVTVEIEYFSFTGDGNNIDATFSFPAGMTPLDVIDLKRYPLIIDIDGTLSIGKIDFQATGAYISPVDESGFTNAAPCVIQSAAFSYLSSDF